MRAGARRLLAAASVLSVTFAAAGADSQWLRFRSERGRFAVMLPGSPEEIPDTRASLVGIVRSCEYLTRRGATEFRVEHHDLPWITQWLVSSDGLLERAQSSLVSEERGRELRSAAASVQGYPAREVSFLVRDERDLAGDALFVLVGRRLYLLATLGPRGERDAAALERFFRSFEVWKP